MDHCLKSALSVEQLKVSYAGLSFMLPPGLPLSYLNKSLPSVEAVVFLSSISGVFPIVSSKCIISPPYSYLHFTHLCQTVKSGYLCYV